MKHMYKRLAVIPATFFLTVSTFAAVIEEIVVTAQKREQNISDVGIAINALTGEQMEQLGYSNAQQVTAMAPGVQTVQPNGEANYSIAIRGVANSDFTTNVESPVAVYVDDVYISQMSGTGFMLFDMERVEILKGPQGTLYGRNATGGLAHFLTKRPTEELDGYARVTAGSENQIKFDGAIGGPLSDTFAARLAIATNDHDPYVKNRVGKDMNDGNEQAYRLQLEWAPSDTVDVLLNFRGMDQDIDTGFFEHVTTTPDGELTPNEINQTIEFFFPGTGYIGNDGDPYAGDFDANGFNDLETRGYTATLNWDAESFTFTSITDFSTVKRVYLEDTDASPVPLFHFFLTTDAEQLSQEFRFTGGTDNFNWVAGLYYMDLDIDDSLGAETEPFVDTGSAITPDVTGLDNPYTSATESYSVFGQVEFQLNDTMSLTGGLRWIRDEKEHDYVVNLVDFIPGTKLRNGNPNILAQLAAYNGDREDDEFAWRLGLDWNVSNDMLVYFSYNRGVKSGGFNAPVIPLDGLDYTDDVMSFDPEQLDAFEVGFKATLFDGLAHVNGAAYYYDYTDYQTFQFVGPNTLTRNSDAESSGAELEFLGSPTEGLDIVIGVAYNDIDLDLGGGQPETTSVQSPQWNANALIRYEFPLGSGTLALQYDAQYRSKHYFSISRTEAATENGYTVQNASITYTGESGKWNVMGFVHNLADEEYLVQTFDLGADFSMTEQYFGRPRWSGVTFTYKINGN